MKSQIIMMLLIAGLNTPVFLELYKHALKNKAIWLKIVVTIVFWGVAIATQTISAFCGILYLYFTVYRHTNKEDSDAVDIWHINGIEALKVVIMTLGARFLILLVHLVYIIILVKLVKYNIKLQDIVEAYSGARMIFKLVLAVEMVLIAPIVEEYVFRYFLYGRILVPRMPIFFATLFSAALFTVAHVNVSGVPTFFGLGLFCTYLFHKKGYWAAVIAHAASNLISLLFI